MNTFMNIHKHKIPLYESIIYRALDKNGLINKDIPGPVEESDSNISAVRLMRLDLKDFIFL